MRWRATSSGDNAALAAELLTKFKATTDAHKHLSGGKLPPAQIDGRARRYAVKLFLSHLQMVWWWMVHNRLAGEALHHGQRRRWHAHLVLPPNMPAKLERALDQHRAA